jgi:hypothetical protein
VEDRLPHGLSGSADRVLPAAPTQLVCVMRKRLPDALDDIQHTNLATDELHQPNRMAPELCPAPPMSKNASPATWDQPQHDRSCPAAAASKVGPLESRRVLTLPDTGVALGGRAGDRACAPRREQPETRDCRASWPSRPVAFWDSFCARIHRWRPSCIAVGSSAPTIPISPFGS